MADDPKMQAGAPRENNGEARVRPDQRWREPSTGKVWRIGAIFSGGRERIALLHGPRGDVRHLKTSVIAKAYERLPDADA